MAAALGVLAHKFTPNVDTLVFRSPWSPAEDDRTIDDCIGETTHACQAESRRVLQYGYRCIYLNYLMRR